jgi:hypothetical protein
MQQNKSTYTAEKMHFGGSRKKPTEAGKNPSEARKKTAEAGKNTSSRESPALQPKKSPQRKKYISAMGKSSSRPKISFLGLKKLILGVWLPKMNFFRVKKAPVN